MTHALFQHQSGQRWLATSIAIIFFLLATIYSLINPIFEAPDELWHYPLVWHLARTGQLPVQDPAQPQLWGQEGSQAPLYYALAALLTAPIPTDDLPGLIYRNPHADIGLVSADGNANVIVHTPREAWPWAGSVLAIHITRFFSAFLGTGTVLTVYALGRVLWPQQPALALLAMSFIAFNPMFIFISGSVNNDNLIILLASLTLWRLVSLVVSGPNYLAETRRQADTPPVWRFVELGVWVGLAALAKATGLILLGHVGITLLYWGLQSRSWRTAILGNGLVGLLAIAIAGWWYGRNIVLYNDLTGTQNIVAMMGPRLFVPTGGQLLAEVPGLMRSFWGLFGYLSVPMPTPLYWLLNLLLVIGLTGIIWSAFWPKSGHRLPSRLKQASPILLAWLALMLMGWLQYNLRILASQGRLLFPALAALAIFWAAGWMVLTPPGWQAIPTLLMLTLSVWIPWGVIAPAYARPDPIASLPPSAQKLEATFGEAVHLLGYESDVSVVSPGQEVTLKLYWVSTQPLATDYTVFVHLLDENGVIVAQRDVFHGPGVYPTSQWTVGEQFGDTYVLNIPHTTYAPTQARFQVGLYNYVTGARLPISTGSDSASFGKIEIRSQSQLKGFPNPQQLQFEDNIVLVGYSLDQRLVTAGENVILTLYWQSEGKPSRDYKIFVHLVGPGENRVAQHDSEPQNGGAPTSGWVPQQVVIDEHLLRIAPDASPGVYQFVVGLYEGDTGRRLRLLRNAGTSVQVNSVTLSGIRVVAP